SPRAYAGPYGAPAPGSSAAHVQGSVRAQRLVGEQRGRDRVAAGRQVERELGGLAGRNRLRRGDGLSALRHGQVVGERSVVAYDDDQIPGRRPYVLRVQAVLGQGEIDGATFADGGGVSAPGERAGADGGQREHEGAEPRHLIPIMISASHEPAVQGPPHL